MIHVTDLSTLRSSHLTEREALVAAAVLPGLPDDECLVRIHDRPRYERPDDTKAFKERAPTVAGTRLRRVEYDGEAAKADAVELTPSPHAIRSYAISGHDFHAFAIPEDDDPDFDDTDQTFLSDFGVTPSPVDAVHVGVTRTDHTFARKPIFPA